MCFKFLSVAPKHPVRTIRFVEQQAVDIQAVHFYVIFQIIPRRNEPVLHLVCGDVGPLEAGVPTKVPLWLAVDLRRKHSCEIVVRLMS